MNKKIAIFGGSFNPPGIHHREIARQLSEAFDEVVVVPCGPRPDKPVTNGVEPIYRAAMVDMGFRGLPRVRVDPFDLEASTFTKTFELEERFKGEGELWHVVGADLLRYGEKGESEIQRFWARGDWLWKNCRFAVLDRPGFNLDERDLPPRHKRIRTSESASSSEIRSRIYHHQGASPFLVPSVDQYIERHGLYRGSLPSRSASFVLSELKCLLVVDERNAAARSLAERLRVHESDEPDVIIVIGGDGTMLRAIRQHWQMRIPIYGLNAGHMGFLLNQESPLNLLNQALLLEQIPLLYVQILGADSVTKEALAFNDAWVERATGQSAWIQVKVNADVRVKQLVADGALVATAAGSSAYARAMGASPLPLNTPALVLVGSNVMHPSSWRPVVLSLDSTVEFSTIDQEKRPLQAYIDGVSQGTVVSLRARVSNIASVELLFSPKHDPATRLAKIQFPDWP